MVFPPPRCLNAISLTSMRKLRQLCKRRLEGYDVVVLFLDGKSFQEDGIAVYLEVTLKGKKVILGFVQTG